MKHFLSILLISCLLFSCNDEQQLHPLHVTGKVYKKIENPYTYGMFSEHNDTTYQIWIMCKDSLIRQKNVSKAEFKSYELNGIYTFEFFE